MILKRTARFKRKLLFFLAYYDSEVMIVLRMNGRRFVPAKPS